MKLHLLVAAVLIAACGPAPEARGPAPSGVGLEPTEAEADRATRRLGEIRAAFLPWYYRARPVRASAAGVRTMDERYPDLSRSGVQTRIDSLLYWLGELDGISFTHLADEDRFDYGALEYAIRGELLDLEEVRSWARDPTVYTGTIGDGVVALVDRPGPLGERLPALRARLEAAPALLDAARRNLSRPPEPWTRRGIEHADDLIRYLEADLPAELGPERDQLVAALVEYRDWLETDLLPRSNGDYRLGRYLFERKLLYEEHIVLGVPELARINSGMVAEYRRALADVAAEIDPDRTPRQIVDSLGAPRLAPAEVLDRARTLTTSLRDWTLERGVVTVPEPEPPVVRATVPHGGRLASLHAPDPGQAGTAYLNIALPRVHWPAERRRARMARLTEPELIGLVARETFPGRYVQHAHEVRAENELRQLFTARSFVDGWAHYAEGMAVDEGFGESDAVIRLIQLRRALEQHARWAAALQIHALAASFEDIVRAYMEVAMVDRPAARTEVLRATYDPLYFTGALGRLQIIELRSDYRTAAQERGEAFVLRDFHDRLLRLALPLPLAREVMLPVSADGGAGPRSNTR